MVKIAVLGHDALAAEWAARHVVFGNQVAVFGDADWSGALARAERGLTRMLLAPLGDLQAPAVSDDPHEAVRDAELVHVTDAALAPADARVLLWSGASPAPAGAISADPIRPVWLLPGVALTLPAAADPEKLLRAEQLLGEIGMTVLRRDIPAGPVPDTFMIAGGGLRLAQGAADDALDTRAEDDLIAMMQALRGGTHPIGAALAAMEDRFNRRAHIGTDRMAGLPDLAFHVPGAWLDYNGHLTESRYHQAFGDGTEGLFTALGADAAHRARGFSFYTLETHLRHLDEAHVGERIRIATRVLEHDTRRIRILHRMYGPTGAEIATCELITIHVDMAAGKSVPMPDAMAERLRRLVAAQNDTGAPAFAGRGIRSLQK
ncbi:thioesterase family protein [Paracoccus pacificus]|uniref:Thioesterase family protein n=1 Tax=Paracoccus pacificus TaxID=1463598 RepID=A0ABW4R2N2_9RHOB